LNLYPEIEAELRKKIKSNDAKLVSEVWSAFKSVLANSPISEHKNVCNYFFNSECCFLDGITYFRISFEYRLNYEVDNEIYDHSEDISCQFKIGGNIELEKEQRFTGGELTSDICGMEQMFSNIEAWKAYRMYKDDELEFDVYACEI